tara:strand:+ start:2810 stop:3151 length:342 start_codon:yes stop_codon:yes gene_type:complete
MLIEIPLIIALTVSLSANLLGFYYMRDLLGRLGWLTQNMMTLNELVKGYESHLKAVYNLEQFYGDEQIKTLVQHTSDLIEVLDDYMEVGLDAELIEEEESDTIIEENNDEKTT